MNLVIIKEMIARIKQDTGIMVVKGNTTAPQPAMPYGVYNITSPYIKSGERGVITQFTDTTGIYEKRTEQSKFTISFSIFAETVEATMESAVKVHQWFLFLGQSFIQDKNLAVVTVGTIEDRTTFIVDDYEYKHGFDVQLRETNEQIRLLSETIEIVL